VSASASAGDGRPRKQVILAAHFPGVNNTTVWADPAAGSQIDFASFEHLARVAERGCFDFFFLAEGLRLREQGGRLYDLDVVGRPDTMTVLSALAAVTTHLGLAGTLNATFHEPYELARQLATLDHLSGGRAAWNVVTSSDAFTGANFRRGGYLDHADRYARAGEVIRAAVRMWDSDGGEFEHPGTHVDIRGRFPVPRSPQRHPVILQAGDSDPGRELAAATADAIFSRHSRPEAARAFYADVKGRLARYGRRPEELKIIPATTFALGHTPEEAAERARHIRRQQVSPQTAILLLEQVWNRDLSAYDPDGPLPEIEPDVTSPSIIQGRARMYSDPVATAADWRQRAESRNLSIRDLVIEVTGRQTFIGTPTQVADAVDDFVQSDAADGVILIPHLTPTGIDDFVERVVPLLQERGAVRAGYETRTLREHLGLPPTNPANRDRTRSTHA
jgi:alkanesulfonate monooxygenase SsuD/methylene tetrahydromethanopterin reductase-like flavin-dependent oxidoreductase (luciferase family)